MHFEINMNIVCNVYCFAASLCIFIKLCVENVTSMRSWDCNLLHNNYGTTRVKRLLASFYHVQLTANSAIELGALQLERKGRRDSCHT